MKLKKAEKALLQKQRDLKAVPRQIKLCEREPGFFFSPATARGYIGMRQGSDGNILVIGGTGSGKSSSIIKPTIETWQGPIFALDIKGELSSWYRQFYEDACAYNIDEPRPYLVFDPSQEDSIGYDPFGWIEQDSEANLVSNILDLALALIPMNPDVRDPFWLDSERAILAAALLYYYRLNLGFSQAILKILSSSISALCTNMEHDGDTIIKMMVFGCSSMKPETLACIERGLRNKLLLFATDPLVSNALSGESEGHKCFTWEALAHQNIFLKIPADKLDVWSPAIRLMLVQLIRHLERQPEKHSLTGVGIPPTLLLLDELPRIGKIDCLTGAVATLRSKSVTLCLVVQSLAQLDAVYGKEQRLIISDNCPWKVILQAGDAETQRHLADLVGTTTVCHRGISTSFDIDGQPIGYNVSLSERRDYLIQPHELATMDDVLLLTPYGTWRVEKYTEHCLLSDLWLSDISNLLRPIRSNGGM